MKLVFTGLTPCSGLTGIKQSSNIYFCKEMKPYLSEIITCQCCLNSDPQRFGEKFSKENYMVLECRQCSFLFIPPYYRKNISYTDYKNDSVLEQVRKGDNWLKIQRHLLRLRLIKQYIRSGKLFDLGAGWGHFMLAGKMVGFDVSGVEISGNPYLYATRDLGLPVERIDFFLLDKPKESFDVITMWDVLEHMDEADKAVEKCSRLLRKNGYMFIQVPQIDSFIAKWKKDEWNMMGIDHVNYFSRRTLPRLLERHGFEVVRIKSSIEIKLFLMYTLLPLMKKLKGEKKSVISSAERQEYYNKVTQKPRWLLKIFVYLHNFIYELLSLINIGEEMIVVARKR